MENVTVGPLRVLLAAGPDVAEAEVWIGRLAEALRRGAVARVLLTHSGLDWSSDERLESLARDPALQIEVCSRNAGDRGWSAEATPDWIGWSSVTTWFRDLRAEEPLWLVMP